jgi:hypothetical protein
MSRFVRLAICSLIVLSFAVPSFAAACGACQNGRCNWDVITHNGCTNKPTTGCTITPPPCALLAPEETSLSNEFAVASVEVKRQNQPTVVEQSSSTTRAAAR